MFGSRFSGFMPMLFLRFPSQYRQLPDAEQDGAPEEQEAEGGLENTVFHNFRSFRSEKPEVIGAPTLPILCQPGLAPWPRATGGIELRKQDAAEDQAHGVELARLR